MRIQAIKGYRPELAVGFKPFIQFFERLRADAVETTLRVCANVNQSGVS
jgi:hypothetical protein